MYLNYVGILNEHLTDKRINEWLDHNKCKNKKKTKKRAKKAKQTKIIKSDLNIAPYLISFQTKL